MGFEYYEPTKKLTIDTHYPDKWRFVDLENGAIWQWHPDKKWVRAEDILVMRNKPPT